VFIAYQVKSKASAKHVDCESKTVTFVTDSNGGTVSLLGNTAM
jgi:hypothetical protein